MGSRMRLRSTIWPSSRLARLYLLHRHTAPFGGEPIQGALGVKSRCKFGRIRAPEPKGSSITLFLNMAYTRHRVFWVGDPSRAWAVGECAAQSEFARFFGSLDSQAVHGCSESGRRPPSAADIGKRGPRASTIRSIAFPPVGGFSAPYFGPTLGRTRPSEVGQGGSTSKIRILG